MGGSALLAAVLVLRPASAGILETLAAGLIMAGYIVGEVFDPQADAAGPTSIEILSLGLAWPSLRWARISGLWRSAYVQAGHDAAGWCFTCNYQPHPNPTQLGEGTVQGAPVNR